MQGQRKLTGLQKAAALRQRQCAILSLSSHTRLCVAAWNTRLLRWCTQRLSWANLRAAKCGLVKLPSKHGPVRSARLVAQCRVQCEPQAR